MTEAIWDKNAIRVKLVKKDGSARLANVPLTMWFKGQLPINSINLDNSSLR